MFRMRRFSLSLILALVAPLLLAGLASQAADPAMRPTPAPAAPSVQPERRVVAYYFHGNVRCRTCRKIEASAADAIQRVFADELKAGRLEWRPTNVEQPANAHFVQDYQLVTRSLVLVELKDGKQVRWKNLDQVWELVSDDIRFAQYVQREVKAFLAGA